MNVFEPKLTPRSCCQRTHQRFVAWMRSFVTRVGRGPYLFWATVIIAFFLSSYYLLLLWYRWLRPDPEFLAFTVNVVQLAAFLFTLVSFLGLQFDTGRDIARRLAAWTRAYWQRRYSLRLMIALWLLTALVAAAFHLGTPWAARFYNQRGLTAFERGRYSAAVHDFRQAVSLAPHYAVAHFNLANTYELLYEYDNAIAEYQVALEQDDSLWPAYNNLGRLYLRARRDPNAALALFMAGLQRTNDDLGRAVLHKNLAEAYMDKGLTQRALQELQRARDILKQLAAQGRPVAFYQAQTYRLQALAYEKERNISEARRAWAAVQGYALAVVASESCAGTDGPIGVDCLNARIWLSEAEERLQSQPAP